MTQIDNDYWIPVIIAKLYYTLFCLLRNQLKRIKCKLNLQKWQLSIPISLPTFPYSNIYIYILFFVWIVEKSIISAKPLSIFKSKNRISTSINTLTSSEFHVFDTFKYFRCKHVETETCGMNWNGQCQKNVCM